MLAYPTIFAWWIPGTSVLPNPVVSAALVLLCLRSTDTYHSFWKCSRAPRTPGFLLASGSSSSLSFANPSRSVPGAAPLQAFLLLELIYCHGITYQPCAGGSQICVSSSDASHVFQPSGSHRPLGFLNISNFTCPDNNSRESIVFCQYLVWDYGPGHSYPRRSQEGIPLSTAPAWSHLINGSPICISVQGRNLPPNPPSPVSRTSSHSIYLPSSPWPPPGLFLLSHLTSTLIFFSIRHT